MNNEEKILQMLEKQGALLEKHGALLSGLQADMAEVKEKLEEVDRRSERTQVLLETDYADKLQLLYEGHKTILDTLAPKSRVEALEEDVDTLKTVMRLLTHDVAELKKAQ